MHRPTDQQTMQMTGTTLVRQIAPGQGVDRTRIWLFPVWLGHHPFQNSRLES